MLEAKHRVFEVGSVEVSVVTASGKKIKAKRGEFIIFDKDGKNPIVVSREVYEKNYKELASGVHSVS